jgi:hypothetical protein
MILTPLESRVRDACLALLAAGVRPSGPELAARIPWRSSKDLIRVRNRLVARRDLPARAGRSSSKGRGPDPIGDDERREIIDACHAIVADGLYPSVTRLRHRFPGRAGQRLAAIRDGAIEAGLIVPGTPSGAGLNGRTAAEIKEVKDRTEAIRKEKVARGEVPRPVELRVAHDRRPKYQGRYDCGS